MEKQRINGLPDELLVKILSSLPIQETVATALISKRWRDLWKLVPDLKFDDEPFGDNVSFMSFVYRSLLFTKAQVLERLCLKLKLPYHRASDINGWVQTAVYRSVKELQINMCGNYLKLPSCLSTCRTLITLELRDLRIKVVQPCFRLPSLKNLHLLSVKFSSDESAERLLSSCPVLENLVVNKKEDDCVIIFNINVPTLRTLSIDNSKRAYTAEIHGFVIKAPSLIYLNIKDTFSNFLMLEHMPEVIKANIEVTCDQSEKFIGSLTSIQHLSLCSLTSKTPYPRGSFFFYLEHLELCTCSAGWWNLLNCILEDAPRLQSLKLKLKHDVHHSDPMNLWKEPTVVPNCLSKHLEILEWREYEGTVQEIEVAAYILANATFLKMATFSPAFENKYHRRLSEQLKSMYRISETCQLVFD